ncbi:MAG: catalase-related domain-containing protein, partial [Candidatus Kurthia intestinigallinarum]
EDDDNYFEQPGKLFNLMSDEQKQLLFNNTAAEMNGVEDFIKERHIIHCHKADPAYGEGVAKALGIDINSIDLNKEIKYF